MASDAALRSSLVWLAVVGFSTYSLKRMLVTYSVRILGIAGLLLPDWEYFDRDVSLWCRPITVDEIGVDAVKRPDSHRFRFYPIRTVIYATVYGFALYKWWAYIAHEQD